jgi:hypothetical protein
MSWRRKLLRAGELRAIWVPDSVHEAVRDLTRAREVAMIDLKVAIANQNSTVHLWSPIELMVYRTSCLLFEFGTSIRPKRNDDRSQGAGLTSGMAEHMKAQTKAPFAAG